MSPSSRFRGALRLLPHQANALASPARLEIVEAFAVLGPSSAGEVAAHLRRSFGSVYHHVVELARAGVLQHVARRPGRRRPETIYRVVAPRLAVVGAGPGPAGQRAVRTLRAVLRQAARDAQSALRMHPDRLRGCFHGTQLSAALRPADLRTVLRHLRKIEEVLRRSNRRRDRHAPMFRWTSLLGPIRRGSAKEEK